MSTHTEPSVARSIPHDVAAEQAVLGACMLAPTTHKRGRRTLVAEDFYRPAHETIWRAMTALASEGQVADAMTVVDRLRAKQNLTRAGGGAAIHTLVEAAPITANLDHHARIVREAAVRRRVIEEATRLIQRAGNGESEVGTLTSEAVTALTAVRDSGQHEPEVRYLADVLDTEDYFDWLVPGLLERGDRLIITGFEGFGKTTLLRQFAVCLAAGVHPFTLERIPNPAQVLFVDAENSETAWRREVRPMVTSVSTFGDDPSWRVALELPKSIDITRDLDLSLLHALADASAAEVLMIGPLYQIVPFAITTDDEFAPVKAALNTFRDRGITLLIEAHAGHQTGRNGRDLRPRGSSAIMGWPEFGIGLRPDEEDPSLVTVEHWRGWREERDFPHSLIKGGRMPFRTDPACYRSNTHQLIPTYPLPAS